MSVIGVKTKARVRSPKREPEPESGLIWKAGRPKEGHRAVATRCRNGTVYSGYFAGTPEPELVDDHDDEREHDDVPELGEEER